MSAGSLILMIIVLTIPMFLRGKIGIDMLLNLESCSDDSTCDDSEFCNDGKCVSKCYNVSCHENEKCQIVDNISSCKCLPNFTRNYEGECLPITTCIDDFTCDSSEFCSNGKCVNACYNKLCKPNEICQISNHNSTCECLHDFIRDDEAECKKIEKCARDEDCDSSKLCTNGMCVIGCNEKCNVNEICQSQNRTFSCECIPDYSRDSDNKCKRQCSSYEICELNEHCQNGLCRPVVISSDKCGVNAVGIRAPHKQLCACPRGFGGDPYIHCLKRCKTNYECEDSEICHDNLCSNACLPSLKRCSYKQKCEVKNHTVNCLNEPSEYKPCKQDRDCDENSYCIRKEALCIPLCDSQTCSDGEKCDIFTFIPSSKYMFRYKECTCNSPKIFVNNSLQCFRPCDSDEICEENEYCYFSNWCFPEIKTSTTTMKATNRVTRKRPK